MPREPRPPRLTADDHYTTIAASVTITEAKRFKALAAEHHWTLTRLVRTALERTYPPEPIAGDR